MRVVSLAGDIDARSLIRAASDEIEAFKKENGGLQDAILVMTVRTCVDYKKENGTTPQRKA